MRKTLRSVLRIILTVSSILLIAERTADAQKLPGGYSGVSADMHPNKSRTVERLAKFMKIDMKTNADAIEEAYKFMRIGTGKKPYPSLDGLRVQLEMIDETEPKAKTARPKQLVDLKIVEELAKGGFIDALYKQSPSAEKQSVKN